MSDESLDVVSNNNEWNIFLNKSLNETAIEKPLYCRSIFISEIESIESLGPKLPSNIQSIGLFVSNHRKKEIIKHLSEYNVDRFPDLGKMSLYQNPWDGYMPLHHMVKWISTN